MEYANETSYGAVVFHRSPARGIQYLLLRRPAGFRTPKPFWEFPKGHADSGESGMEAAVREIREEAGVEMRILGGFQEEVRYTFSDNGKDVRKTAWYVLGEADSEHVLLSQEHDAYAWASFEEACALLSFSTLRDLLRKAHDFLSKEGV